MVSAQQTARVTASGIGYLEYLPQGYKSNSNKYPLVISLHGVKEKGTSSTDRSRVLADLEKVDNVGLPKYVKSGKRYPFILISPQLKSNHGLWSGDYVMQVLNHVKKHLRIDDRRIYLTGLSLGGFGVWRAAGDYPDVFAAIAPICSGGNALKKANAIAAENLPAWGFHGSRDHIVSHNVTIKMVNAINASPRKPNPLAKATIFQGMGHSIWDKAYNETNLLNWMLSHRKGSPSSKDEPPKDESADGGSEEEDDNKANKAPVVKAGPDKTLTLPANAVNLQGSASDPDGEIVSYQWTKVSGGSANLSGANTEEFRARNLKAGTYVFRLTAKDNDGKAKSDDVRVIVKKSTKKKSSTSKKEENSKNKLPLASAGPDRVITLPDNSVTVNANASDKDGKIVSYQWVKTYGKRARLGGANSASVRISSLDEGHYIFRLRVKDNDGGVKDDFFKITVKPSDKKSGGKDDSKKSSAKRNARPVANAGPDIKIKISQGSVQLIGSARDPDGKIVSYQWRKIAGPGVTVRNARSPKTTLTNLREGRYYFALTVKDDKNATHVDKMALRVSK